MTAYYYTQTITYSTFMNTSVTNRDRDLRNKDSFLIRLQFRLYVNVECRPLFWNVSLMFTIQYEQAVFHVYCIIYTSNTDQPYILFIYCSRICRSGRPKICLHLPQGYGWICTECASLNQGNLTINLQQ